MPVPKSATEPERAFSFGMSISSSVRGGKPADVPVLQSTRFEFAINL